MAGLAVLWQKVAMQEYISQHFQKFQGFKKTLFLFEIS
jgi:hypothetical protein